MSGNRWNKGLNYGLSPWEALFVAVLDQAILDTKDENILVKEAAKVWLATGAKDFVGFANISAVEFQRGLIASGVLTTEEIDFYNERVQL